MGTLALPRGSVSPKYAFFEKNKRFLLRDFGDLRGVWTKV
jgi:hypothetical protein